MLSIGKTKNAERSAFTLIELILVMTILLTVIAVAAPSLARFFHGRTLDSEARRLVSLTRFAQSRAVSEGMPMVLWIDKNQRVYGLRQETSVTDQDPKAVEFEFGKDLKIEVADVPQVSGTLTQLEKNQQMDATRPVFRFQPDGFMSENNPRSIVIEENNGDTIWISLSRNQLNYEIETNATRHVRR